jgi:hypothetical protein
MVNALKHHGMDVWASDIDGGTNFLEVKATPDHRVTAIVTNPPYELAREFIEHSFEFMHIRLSPTPPKYIFINLHPIRLTPTDTSGRVSDIR